MFRIVLLLIGFFGTSLFGNDIQHIAGDYKVAEIKSTSGGAFRVVFEAKEKSGKFDRLILDSDHVHVGVKPGSVLRISGEVAAVSDAGVVELKQVMVLLPSREGSMPVWMLSRKHPTKGLRGARYLQMHSPNADFLVF